MSTRITPGPPQIDEGADKKGPTYDIVGPETDALTMLNAALHGVDALHDAISLMEQAAGKIVIAGDDGKRAIFEYVENTAKPKIYPTYVQETVQPAIDRYAAEAVSRAMKALAQLQALLDSFLASIRQGGSSV